MRLLRWILVLSVTLAAVLFAVSNRQLAEVHLWPLPLVIDSPVYLIALGSLVLGFLIGAVAAWYNGVRRRLRRRAREKLAAGKNQMPALRPDKIAPAGS